MHLIHRHLLVTIRSFTLGKLSYPCYPTVRACDIITTYISMRLKIYDDMNDDINISIPNYINVTVVTTSYMLRCGVGEENPHKI